MKYDDCKTTSIYSAKLNRRQDSNSSPSDSRTYKRPSNRYQTVDHLCNPIDHNHNDYQQSSHSPDTTPCRVSNDRRRLLHRSRSLRLTAVSESKLCERILLYTDELAPVPDSTRTPDRSSTGFDDSSTGFDGSKTGFDGSSTGFDRSRTGFDRSRPDSTGVEPDSTGVGPDSTGVGPDSTGV